MADLEDIVDNGHVSAPNLSESFPSLNEQRRVSPPEEYRMNDVSTDKQASAPVKEYGIIGGLSYVPEDQYIALNGQQKSFETHQEYVAVQTFVSPHLSYVLGSNLNNSYGDDSLVLTGCAETERLGHTVSLGACAGIEYGLDEHVAPELLIKGQNLTPKAEVYMMFRAEGFSPELKVGVENLPTPQGDHEPVYTMQVRFPIPH